MVPSDEILNTSNALKITTSQKRRERSFVLYLNFRKVECLPVIAHRLQARSHHEVTPAQADEMPAVDGITRR